MTAPKPVRMRLSRAKGADIHAAAKALNGLPVLVITRPGPLGNPFIVGKHGTRAECVDLHRKLLAGYVCLGYGNDHVQDQQDHLAHVRALVVSGEALNKNVACVCSLGGPCHGDNLLEAFNFGPLALANRGEP